MPQHLPDHHRDTDRRVRQNRRCYRIEDTGGLVRLSKASLAGSELFSSAKGEASPVPGEFLAG